MFCFTWLSGIIEIESDENPSCRLHALNFPVFLKPIFLLSSHSFKISVHSDLKIDKCEDVEAFVGKGIRGIVNK